jgi:phospho-N-acetylmuramoyl-pentapeptide-transferase
VNLGSITIALLLAFIGMVILAPIYIGLLQRLGYGKQIRTDGPEAHFGKAGTPTMGGMLVVAVVLFLAMALRIEDAATLTPLLTLMGVGILGAVDDFVNVRSGVGMRGRWKLVWQTVVALLAGWYIVRHFHLTGLNIPLVGQIEVAGLFLVLFIAFVIVGTSNAVNLTDGLDGLAIMPTVLVGSALGIFAYVAGHAVFSKYLGLPHIPGAGELAVICGALAGAGLGFLWFNAYPAEVFMGDVGALALGAALGTMAVIVRQEIVLFIMGGVFVAETLSVMIQVVYFKWSGGKRVFRMAPLHHHYELEGWKESQVVVRFWIITMMLVLFGLSTLKLR